jgi:hypothetical protein
VVGGTGDRQGGKERDAQKEIAALLMVVGFMMASGRLWRDAGINAA